MRRTTRAASACVAATALGLGLAAPGTAATSETYHGYYDGVTTYTPYTPGDADCPSSQLVVTGTWNVRIAGDRASMSTNLFYGGEHHLAYGGRALDQFDVVSPAPTGAQFQIRGDVGDTGVTVTLTLSEDGDLTYVVAPYPPLRFGSNCASLTLTGHEGRPAVP